ncbi:BspA family leucine-rich repeat surface protein [Ruminococcus flavefaciens]|uniref:Surface protein n=1 Tax=Ruminococcus flavefaciens TaxID=1265 RepID=A0A315Y1L7_RUMFL|nr:BspA family leucine-rich repeat surface protein [Ruminococcus flavefaciens]PWJ14176.1 surface protein [Ruminococcus flavefaciens]SSA43905.1 surface protein [Ruminococcus flavefaciens]
MNYTHKKITAALLSLLIIGGTAPVLGRADVFRPVVASAIDNNVITYDETTHVLTLRGEFDNYTLEKYKDKGVKTIVAEEGAALVEYAAFLFRDFKTVEKIDLTNLDASRAKYVYDMFENCTALKEVKLPDFTNTSITDVSWMFYNCYSLENIDLSKLNTPNVTNFRGMFSGCLSLKTLDVSCLDTSNATDIQNMFEKCSVLKNIDLSSWDTKNLVYFSYLFQDCTSLEKVDLSGLNTSKSPGASDVFFNCAKLRDIDLSALDTSNMTWMSGWFGCCYSLENVNFNVLDTSDVNTMRGLFSNCTSLKSLDLSGMDTSRLYDASSMFYNCPLLKELDLSCIDTSNLIQMNDMFKGDKKLEHLDLSSSNFDKVTSASDVFKECDTLAPYISTINGASISLDGDISVNYYVTLGSSASKAVLIGPNGAVLIDDLASCKRENGSYKFSYPVNAVQMSDEVTLKVYSDDGKQHIILKSSGAPASYAKGAYSVRSYVADSGKYLSDTKLTALVEALNNYGYAAENFFFDKGFTVSGISGVKKSDVEAYKPTFGTDPAVSLVMGSETSLRFYTLSDNVRIDDAKATAKTSQFGRFYEIKNIPAHELLKPHKLTVDGNDYTVTPMAYVYRVLDNSAASNKLKDVAKAVYVYAKAAETYMNAQ